MSEDPSDKVSVAEFAGAVTATLLIEVALATPSVGVVNDGLVDKAMPPEPVTFWPNAVATPVPNDVIPVPPLATTRVPASVIVPDVVIGPPDVVRPVVPPETSTDVTVPDPPPVAVKVPAE
jgi:hypothetical protein